MKNPFVDMHVHSFYSDGSMSPGEIVAAAVQNGVGVLAVADHNILDGSIETQKLCKERGIHCIPAVELNTLDGESDIHILAYDFDMENQQFTDVIKHVRFLLDESSVKLIELMQVDYQNISLTEFMEFTYDRKLGAWKSLHYLIEKGLVSSKKEAMEFYLNYNISHERSGYPTIAATIYRIKRASGYAVLAHPGEVIDSSDIGRFKEELRRIIALGIDGIECYYPSHSAEVTNVCLELCDEYNLFVTAGSDCHGDFGRKKTYVGEMGITKQQIRLR